MSFFEIITWPFAQLLLSLYKVTGNYGLAIILFALIVKLVLLPFQMKSKKSMMRTQSLNPILKKLEKRHEGNKQKYQEEVSKLYKEEKINPMSGCIWSLIPFPILIALYSVIRQPLSKMMYIGADTLSNIVDKASSLGYTMGTDAYAEIKLADFIHGNFDKFSGLSDKLVDMDFSFLGLNLGDQPQWNFFFKTDFSDLAVWGVAFGLFLIPVISALLSYFAMKVSQKATQTPGQENPMKGMNLMMPLMSLYIGFIMPAALGIYWIANSGLGMIQDIILNKHYGKILAVENAEREERMNARERELERKRQETERKREAGETERNRNTSKKKIHLKERTENEERIAEERAARRLELGLTDDKPDSQVGTRKFARGRAYVADRFENPEMAEEATILAANRSELEDKIDHEFEEEVMEEVSEEVSEEVVAEVETEVEAEVETETEDEKN